MEIKDLSICKNISFSWIERLNTVNMAEEPEIKWPTSVGSSKTQESSRTNIYFCFIDYIKAFYCVGPNKLWKILQETGIPPDLLPEKPNIKKQQLELDMEQQTGSKFGKEYVKGTYCHPAYLTYMQSISCEMPGWMKHKLESSLLGEI